MHDTHERLLACIPRLRRYARALVGRREDADDLVQDTMERAWDRLASWQAGTDMRAWLFGIMHNLHVDRLRRQPPACDALDEDTLMNAAVNNPSAGLEMRDMETALMLLPVDQREVLLLVALENMRYEQVAEALHIPVGTVMSRLSRARARLHALLEGQPGAPALKVVK
ncbi:RNA polymerase sigma factor [Leeia oryzae]|uniref:RNA polymerase sigma factor n=1 Tax=Leeia oryzae TaxID=356662 RepID=UPI00037C119A|nr:RNA polymerase sigma factor [Leeia oryzae]